MSANLDLASINSWIRKTGRRLRALARHSGHRVRSTLTGRANAPILKEEIEALLNIYKVLGGPESFEEKAWLVTEEIVKVSEAERVTLRLADEDAQGLH